MNDIMHEIIIVLVMSIYIRKTALLRLW